MPGARVDARVLEALPRMPALQVVQTLSAGVDWLLGSVPAGVTVCDAGGARDTAVAEWVVAATLASTKALPELHNRRARAQVGVAQDQGARRQHRGCARLRLDRCRLGGGATGPVRGRADPGGRRRAREGVHGVEDLDEVLPRADVVVVLVPLTPATTGLVGAEQLARMRPGALSSTPRAGRSWTTARCSRSSKAGGSEQRWTRPIRAAAPRAPPGGRTGATGYPPPRGRHRGGRPARVRARRRAGAAGTSAENP